VLTDDVDAAGRKLDYICVNAKRIAMEFPRALR